MTLIEAITTNEQHTCNDADCPQGNYYVSCIDDLQRYYLMAGPYNTHAEALAEVRRVREIACNVNDRAVWMYWGTLRMKDGTNKPGKMNELGLL